MKAVCNKHHYAYEMGIGCPWCEPAQAPVGKVELPERTLEWAERLVKGPTFMRLMNDGRDVTQGFQVTPTRNGPAWAFAHKFKGFEGPVTGIALYDSRGVRQYESTFPLYVVNLTCTFEFTVTLTF